YLAELSKTAAVQDLKRIIYIGADSPVPPAGPGWYPYAGLRARAADVPEADIDAGGRLVGVDDVINMQYTSGTTGFPKGVMLSSRNIVNNGYWMAQGLNYTPLDRL